MSRKQPTGVCPHDGQPAPHQTARYFDALCWDCVDRGTDASGRVVSVHDLSMDELFEATHRDDGSPCQSVTTTQTLFVDTVAHYVTQAHFGGVVVRPAISARTGWVPAMYLRTPTS